MVTTGPVGGDDIAAPTPPQARVIAAALDLFAKYGVGGTSLQMIADRIGVTKAAVYHQFKTKDEIVLAVAVAELARVDAVLAVAEAQPTQDRARDALLRGIVELAVERRRTVATILTDPAIVGFFADHDTFRDVMQRLRRLLIASEAGPEARVRVAMVFAAISGAVIHPFVVDLDDRVLQEQLLALAQGFIGLPV